MFMSLHAKMNSNIALKVYLCNFVFRGRCPRAEIIIIVKLDDHYVRTVV